jgi:molybdenum cofactor synthesis domain-containing protein
MSALQHRQEHYAIGILTVSDRCARGELPDTAGPAVGELVATSHLGRVARTECVPDDVDLIRTRLVAWSAPQDSIDLILTVGGTGLGPRDVTPEATLAVLERRHDGLPELMRLRAYPANPKAFLSRGIAGTIAHTLVVNLPGSKRGSTECLQAILDVLPHALATLRGDDQHHDERLPIR